jgi:hypothetical protein
MDMPPMESEIEITGHILAQMNASVTPSTPGISPLDIDLFITLRLISIEGKEVLYTGTTGDLAPFCKG